MNSFIFSFHPVLYLTSNLLLQAAPETDDGPLYNSSNPASQNKQEQIATNHLIEVMQHLTLNPGKFDVLITPLVDTFSRWLGDAEKVSSIVNAIVEQVSYN
jgi:hypothetical protein